MSPEDVCAPPPFQNRALLCIGETKYQSIPQACGQELDVTQCMSACRTVLAQCTALPTAQQQPIKLSGKGMDLPFARDVLSCMNVQGGTCGSAAHIFDGLSTMLTVRPALKVSTVLGSLHIMGVLGPNHH